MGAGHALVATGTVSLIGVPGVTITGTTSVRVNNTGQAVNQTIEIPGSTEPGVLVNFATAAAVTEFVVSDATLAFGAQSLTGTFSFERDGTDLTLAVDDGAVAFGDAVQLGEITGGLVVRPGGIAGVAERRRSRSPRSGVTTVAATVAVNTAPAAVDGRRHRRLPAGPYVRVVAHRSRTSTSSGRRSAPTSPSSAPRTAECRPRSSGSRTSRCSSATTAAHRAH